MTPAYSNLDKHMQEDIVCFHGAGPDPVAVMLQANMVQKLFTSSFKDQQFHEFHPFNGVS